MKIAIDFEPALKKIKETGAKRIGIQVAEGLKTRVLEFTERISAETGAEVIIYADPSFGACDIADDKAKELGCDLLVHFGHSKMIHEQVPTIYVEWRYDDVDVQGVIPKIVKQLKDKGFTKVGLTTTIQFLHLLPELEKGLVKHGIHAVVGKNSPRITYPGQVLGCDYSVARNVAEGADALLYFGDGIFHPLGLALTYEKPTLIADPFSQEARYLDKEKEKYLRQRWGQIAIAKNGKRFGVLIGIKRGQRRLNMAFNVKKALENAGYEAFLVAGVFFHPLLSFFSLGLLAKSMVSMDKMHNGIHGAEGAHWAAERYKYLKGDYDEEGLRTLSNALGERGVGMMEKAWAAKLKDPVRPLVKMGNALLFPGTMYLWNADFRKCKSRVKKAGKLPV